MREFDAKKPSEVGRDRRSLKRAAMVGAAAIALIAGGAAGGAVLRGATEAHAAALTRAAPAAAAAAPASFADIAARVKPAVVSVKVKIVNAAAEQMATPPGFGDDGPFGEFFKRFGMPFSDFSQMPREMQAQGSGFFVSPDGYIVTNNHVVQNARSVTVTLDGQRTVDAHVVATDPRTDLAVIKTESGGDYPYVKFAAAEPRIGDWVLAVGNPFGLGGTVTAGIISANGRDIGAGPYDDFIQIDAPVNQGNSGGPTFNLNGEVVGVNTAIYSPSGGNVGIAFAIPATTAEPIVASLVHGGQIVRGYLGVALQPLDESLANALALKAQEGALVASVNDGSPAARAGLKEGDVVLRAAGAPVSNARDLARIVAAHRPGSNITLEYSRGGHRAEAKATLASLPPDVDKSPTGVLPQQSDEVQTALGLTVAPVAGGDGIQITAVNPASAAAAEGLEAGDIIMSAGGRPCSSAADLKNAISAARGERRDAVLLRLRSGDTARFVGVPIANS